MDARPASLSLLTICTTAAKLDAKISELVLANILNPVESQRCWLICVLRNVDHSILSIYTIVYNS